MIFLFIYFILVLSEVIKFDIQWFVTFILIQLVYLYFVKPKLSGFDITIGGSE